MLWFWFVFLSTVSAIQMVWRILSIISVWMREFTLSQISNRMARLEDTIGILSSTIAECNDVRATLPEPPWVWRNPRVPEPRGRRGPASRAQG